MDHPIDLTRLQDFFEDEDIEWKPIAVSKKTGKALAAAYITNRAIMDRLDEVCGPANWKNEFQPGPGGGVICGLSIRVPTPEGGSEWVTKWDGSENTDVQAVKGGLSTSMRRAAVQWGIGRYIYRLPSQWVPVDQHGRFAQPPRMPDEFLPRGAGTKRAVEAPAGEDAASNGHRADPPRSRPDPSTRNRRSRPADIEQYRASG